MKDYRGRKIHKCFGFGKWRGLIIGENALHQHSGGISFDLPLVAFAPAAALKMTRVESVAVRRLRHSKPNRTCRVLKRA